ADRFLAADRRGLLRRIDDQQRRAGTDLVACGGEDLVNVPVDLGLDLDGVQRSYDRDVFADVPDRHRLDRLDLDRHRGHPLWAARMPPMAPGGADAGDPTQKGAPSTRSRRQGFTSCRPNVITRAPANKTPRACGRARLPA